jgi:hypothetical protein
MHLKLIPERIAKEIRETARYYKMTPSDYIVWLHQTRLSFEPRQREQGMGQCISEEETALTDISRKKKKRKKK